MPKILVCDDSITASKITETQLKEAGYEQLIMTDSGDEALEKIQEDPPDIAIIDGFLPDMSGFTVCREIKKMDIPTKVIILTGLEVLNKEKADRAGADEHVMKSEDGQALIEAVKKYS